jgi:3-oxoacyl-[acyl-carrier-protein] synthase II
MRRVVVTCLGVISPVGIGVDAFWKHLTAGVSGVRRITKFDASALPSQIAAEITGFDPETYLPRRDIVRTDTFIHYALTAAQQALADAKLEPSTGDARMGVSIGTSPGGLPLVLRTYEGLLQEQLRGVNPYAMPGFLPNMAAGWVSMRTGARGPIACATTVCAAGAQAVGDGSRFIARNDADVMIAGGSDALISPFVVACFSALRALSTRNDLRPRPVALSTGIATGSSWAREPGSSYWRSSNARGAAAATSMPSWPATGSRPTRITPRRPRPMGTPGR